MGTTMLILPRCQKLTTLTICFIYCHMPCTARNPLLLLLLELKELKCLYIGLTALYTNHRVFLPGIEFLNRPIHLHLSSSRMASISIPLGFTDLTSLAHLSISCAIGCSCTPSLQKFLDISSSVVLIQWYDEYYSLSDVKANLRKRELVDQQIVVLGVRLMVHHENDESIWIFTECIVKWRVDNKSKYSHLCLITIDQLSVANAFATPTTSEWEKTMEGITVQKQWGGICAKGGGHAKCVFISGNRDVSGSCSWVRNPGPMFEGYLQLVIVTQQVVGENIKMRRGTLFHGVIWVLALPERLRRRKGDEWDVLLSLHHT